MFLLRHHMLFYVVAAPYFSNICLLKPDEEQKRKEKKERQLLERRYMLPDSPSIIVHPNPTAKSGKFDCSIMTLSLLLDYRPEDNKEHSFEVSEIYAVTGFCLLIISCLQFKLNGQREVNIKSVIFCQTTIVLRLQH